MPNRKNPFTLCLMRQPFAHEAVITMEPDADVNALGAAITVELCGHWDHEPPCPLAPHHSQAARNGGVVQLRTLFAAEPDMESTVRRRIDAALTSGQLHGADGSTTIWQLQTSRGSPVTDAETGHAQRLTRS